MLPFARAGILPAGAALKEVSPQIMRLKPKFLVKFFGFIRKFSAFVLTLIGLP